jgi:hypothetical protein
MSKRALSMLTALAVAAALTMAPAQAGKKAKAIAIAVGATALVAAAAAAANADRNDAYYDFSYGHTFEQNAVAACTDKAQRKTEKDGGYQLILRGVDNSKYYADGTWRVKIDLLQYGPWGRNKAKAQCVVKFDRVIDFHWIG